MQVAGQSGNDGGAIAFPLLTLVDHPADAPVQADHFGVHRQPGPAWAWRMCRLISPSNWAYCGAETTVVGAFFLLTL